MKGAASMDNYEAIAYAKVAVNELRKNGKEITEKSIQREMIYQMDMNSESEILKKAEKIK
jgi:hypothetical protein